MRSLVVLLVACGAPPKQPVVEPPPPPPSPAAKKLEPVHHCPPLSYNNVGFWRQELFPACQDDPFDGIHFCKGKPCAEQPCKTTHGNRERLHFYENGRFVSTTYNGKTELECFYDGALRTHCIWDNGRWSVERDSNKRITAIVGPRHRATVVHDERGRMTTVDDLAVVYDGEGRMIQLGEFTFEWEGDRVVVDRSPERAARHEYDASGRLVRMHYEERPPRTLTVEYDGDRVEGWKSDSVEIDYVYDCQ